MQPMRQLWTTGHAPAFFRAVLVLVRMMGAGPVSSGLRIGVE